MRYNFTPFSENKIQIILNWNQPLLSSRKAKWTNFSPKYQKYWLLFLTHMSFPLTFPPLFHLFSCLSSISCSAGLTMSQRFTPRIPAGLSPAHSPPLIRLLSAPPGHGSLAWAGACLAFARQVWPQGLRGHAKCNMGSGQQCWAEIGAAGAGVPSTGAERRRERERGIRKREVGDWREEGGEREREKLRKREKREGHGGRPVGDPTPQRGKVMAYTQASHPKTLASTRTHIKIMQTKKARESHVSAPWPVQKSTHAGWISLDFVINYYFWYYYCYREGTGPRHL